MNDLYALQGSIPLMLLLPDGSQFALTWTKNGLEISAILAPTVEGSAPTLAIELHVLPVSRDVITVQSR